MSVYNYAFPTWRNTLPAQAFFLIARHLRVAFGPRVCVGSRHFLPSADRLIRKRVSTLDKVDNGFVN